MTLSQKIAAALASGNNHSGPLEIATPSHRLGLDVVVSNALGVEANLLEFDVLAPPRDDRTLDELCAWADRVAAKVTYLMEPLHLIEADAQGVEVELRSQTPTPRAGTRNYFEARLNRAGHLTIARLAFDNATRTRHRVPFQLTREVLERLADDLVATAG